MSAPRRHGWLIVIALGVVLALTPAASAQGQEDLPPIMPKDLSADPGFKNVSADTEEMSFTVQLAAVEETYTGDFSVDIEIQDERVALIEDTWTAGRQTMNVSSHEDADEGPGTWSPSVGLHPFNLTVSADGKSFPLEFKLPAGPDLSVERSGDRGPDSEAAITMEPADPAPGDEVTFRVNVTNQGSWATPEGTEIPVWLTLDGEPIGQATVQELPSQEETQLVFEDAWTAEGGHHTLAAEADPDAIDEILDENNNASTTFTVAQPGLSVRELDLTPDPAPLNESVTVEATLQNTAAEDRGTTTTAIYVDGQLHRETSTRPIEAGETTNVTWTLYPEVGVHEVTVLPEAGDPPEQPPEDPSSATRQVTVGPDLVVTAVDSTPAQPLAGEEVTVNATVENRGASLNETVPVALVDRAEGGELARTNLSALAAGATGEIEVTVQPETGDNDLVLQLDPDQTTAQADRSNDHAFVSFTVRETEPQLVIESLGFAERELMPGEQAPAQVTVTNEGDNTLTDLEARFRVDGDPLGSAARLGSLEPGETSTVESRNWTASPGGHELDVRLGNPHDFAAGSPLASATRTVTVADAETQIAVGELATMPADPSPGDEVRLVLEVTNEGSVPTPGFRVRFTVDGERIGMATVDELAPGDNRTLESPAWTLDAETSTATAVVAPDSATLEEHRVDATLGETGTSDVPGPGLLAMLAAALAALTRCKPRRP